MTYAGWQQGSNWTLPYQGGTNGADLSPYTPNDFGVQTANFTVHSIPPRAFGSLGASIGGVTIAVNQKTHLSAIGFWE